MTDKSKTDDQLPVSGQDKKPTPVLSLRDVVVYPHMVIPLFIGRERSMAALQQAMDVDKKILLITQRSSDVDDPEQKDLYQVGTLANILQLLRLPDGTTKVLVEGTERVATSSFLDTGEYLTANWQALPGRNSDDELTVEVTARSLVTLFERYIKLNRKIPAELLTTLVGIDDNSRLADTIAAHLGVRLEEKQKILEIADIQKRMEKLLALIEEELDMLQLEKRIRGRVKGQMEKSQREYYLNEQMKAIQKELNEIEDAPDDLEELEQRIDKAGLPKQALEKVLNEMRKLRMMSPMSAEATVVRNYLDMVLGLPWKKRSKVNKNILRAEEVLDEDHYALEKVKERIAEYLAVQQRVKSMKGPILCLVGPPGVGKTSLGKSIAKATGREFVRMSLGGVRDEAEIRGHRRTYIGSMPGRILQSMAKAGKKNPLFMLDELDKMSMDFRGDPSSALLEVLDPEQNDKFSDHYLEVDYDLSEVMFICTANSLNIPAPLLDRMEVIRIPGYTEDEKEHIARDHLWPKQISQHGLSDAEIKVSDSVIRNIIRYYTQEAGVRSLERQLAKLCRKVVKELSTDKQRDHRQITVRNLDHYLGVQQYRYDNADEDPEIGQVNGLAWTSVGGVLLKIEATLVPGKGKLMQTGQLGEVMQESVQAALTVVRSRSDILGLPKDFHQNNDFHIHVPEGATPKDGPSAGIAMCVALVSVVAKIPVRADVAMTGEITLRGKVLPIGGLKEKLLAAHRSGIKTVLIPDENAKDLIEIPQNILAGLTIHPVKWIDEVLEKALISMPRPLVKAAESAPIKQDGDEKSDRIVSH
ncbi:MAG: endopeptidase La [Gammaproteobacteria bacterium]|jgi:ATP-dependent Lon protease|nr:endopeptidase La [Gammaproteobacteria bacterium]